MSARAAGNASINLQNTLGPGERWLYVTNWVTVVHD